MALLRFTTTTNLIKSNINFTITRLGYKVIYCLSLFLCLICNDGAIVTDNDNNNYNNVNEDDINFEFDIDQIREARAFCDTERNVAQSCLQRQSRAVQGCRTCVDNTEDRALASGTISCNTYTSDLCNAINNCNCGSCTDAYINLHACNLRSLSNGQCNSFTCTNPVCSIIQVLFGSCPGCTFISYIFGQCGRGGSNTGGGILGPTPIGVPPRPGPTPAPVPSQAMNDPTVVQPTSTPTVVCPNERDDVNNCLEQNTDFTCGECIESAYNAFVDLGTYNCNDFTTSVCPAIQSDCTSCDPCRDVIDTLYQCVVEFENVCTTDVNDVCPITPGGGDGGDGGICSLFIISFFCSIADFIGNLFGI